MGSLKQDLAAATEELCETHVSWVFLEGDRVYKVKKPVNLGFLDFSSVQKRKAACQAELELNRRLAPWVYLDVVPITVAADGKHQIGGSGTPVDWAVMMQRLDESQRADNLLELDKLGRRDVDRMAAVLAEFHASARMDNETSRYGDPELIAQNVRENIEQAREHIAEHIDPTAGKEIGQWQLKFLAQRASAFQKRILEGKVRDGHGDLKLEHFYLAPDKVTVVDCIEFNSRFRFGDVASDLAFLSMDLSAKGRVALAERLIASYAKLTSDYELYELIDFYESYRAYVKAKISMFLAEDTGASAEIREAAKQQARHYFLLALATEHRALSQPWLICVGGLIASGKSTLAEELSYGLGAPVVSSDRLRKYLVAASAEEPLHDEPFSGRYDDTTSEQVYTELLRNAELVLRSGRCVVVDASFRSRKLRKRAQALATSVGVPFRFVECQADAELVRSRLLERAKTASVSDGRLEIYEAFASAWESVTEFDESTHIIVDTCKPLEDNLALLEQQLPVWPANS